MTYKACLWLNSKCQGTAQGELTHQAARAPADRGALVHICLKHLELAWLQRMWTTHTKCFPPAIVTAI